MTLYFTIHTYKELCLSMSVCLFVYLSVYYHFKSKQLLNELR